MSRQKGTWRPVTAAEYDAMLEAALGDIDTLRRAVNARYAGHGDRATAPRRAAELRELRAAVAALLAGPGLVE